MRSTRSRPLLLDVLPRRAQPATQGGQRAGSNRAIIAQSTGFTVGRPCSGGQSPVGHAN
jgi:hypothetical protein